MIEFRMPSLGADMDEGTLLEWQVAPGEAVHRGQVVAVVDTAKAAVEIECWQAGTLFELLILEGAQAGLSWSTILKKREHYRAVFDGFDPQRIAAYDEARVLPCSLTRASCATAPRSRRRSVMPGRSSRCRHAEVAQRAG